MKIDLNRIEQTLELIAHGQLAPEAAARNLLGIAAAPPGVPPGVPPGEPQPARLDRPLAQPLCPPRQSLAQLVRSLGTPPAEIEHDWRRQIQSLAHDWQQTRGGPLPPLELSAVWVDADNRLSLDGQSLTANRPATPRGNACAAAPATPDTGLHAASGTAADTPEPAVAPLLGRRSRTLAALALAACTVLVLYGGWHFRAAREPHTAAHSQPETHSAGPPSPLTSSPPAPRQPRAVSPNALPEPLPTRVTLDLADAEATADPLTMDEPLQSAEFPSVASGSADTPAATADLPAPPATPPHRPTDSPHTAADSLPPSPPLPPPAPASPPQAGVAWQVRFQFAEPQASAAWPLTAPAEVTAADFAAAVDVPEAVQLTWIEPLTPHHLRRSAGRLQWAPAGAETPLIGCRIELRCATNLSLKLHYAAQLDPSLPWQTFTPEQLEQAVDRAGLTLQRLLAQQSELGRQYTAANSSGRRLLKPHKDAMDQQVQRLQTLSLRLQQLLDLQAAVAQDATLRITLARQRPDQPQSIAERGGASN